MALVSTTVVITFLSFGWITITYFPLAVCIGVCSGSGLLAATAAPRPVVAAPRRLFRGGLRPAAAWDTARPDVGAWTARVRGRGGYAG
jgi:hypothetical protein